MDNAMHISRIIGPVFFILSLIIMFDKKRVDEAIKSLQEITGLQLIVGMVNLLLGLIIISFYNVWAWNWGLLVTVFAWFAVLRGVLILLFPKAVRGFKDLYSWHGAYCFAGLDFSLCSQTHCLSSKRKQYCLVEYFFYFASKGGSWLSPFCLQIWSICTIEKREMFFHL